MADEKENIIPFNKTFEAIISYIPKERALIRVAASSEDLARTMIKDMATDNVTELTIESVREVSDEEPIPQGFEAPETPETPKVH